jgi:hypothetical protein
MEQWNFVTSPESCDNIITLQGVAVRDDVYAPKRQRIEKIISDRRSMVAALDTIEFILQNVYSHSGPAHSNHNAERLIFEAQNQATKVIYAHSSFGIHLVCSSSCRSLRRGLSMSFPSMGFGIDRSPVSMR